jgi:hypothetical protein
LNELVKKARGQLTADRSKSSNPKRARKIMPTKQPANAGDTVSIMDGLTTALDMLRIIDGLLDQNKIAGVKIDRGGNKPEHLEPAEIRNRVQLAKRALNTALVQYNEVTKDLAAPKKPRSQKGQGGA